MFESVTHLSIIFSISLFFSLINSFIAYKIGFFKQLNQDKKDSLYFSDVAWVFVLFLGIQILIVPFSIQLWLWTVNGSSTTVSELNQVSLAWANIVSIILSLITITAYYQFIAPRTKTIIWGSSPKIFKNIFVGFVTWLICFPIVTAIGNLIGMTILSLFQKKPVDQSAVKFLKFAMHDHILFLIIGVVVIFIVPVLEEILFRGYLQTWLRKFFKPRNAIILSSAIFALFHFSFEQKLQNFELLTALFVMSCFLGYLYERQKSLWAPIGLHMIFNSMSILFLILEQSNY